MLNKCKKEQAIFPSLESLRSRTLVPKVHLLFYECFFKAALTNTEWKKTVESCTVGRPQRFSTEIMEAFVLSVLEDKYFAWLYEYYTDLAIRKKGNKEKNRDPTYFLKLDYHVFSEEENQNGRELLRACDLFFDGQNFEVQKTANDYILVPKGNDKYDSLRKKLASDRSIERMVEKDGRLVITAPSDDRTVRKIIKAIDACRESLVSLDISDASLTEIFETLTKKER